MVVAAALAGLLALVGTKPAEAAFPGDNGVVAFASKRVTATNPTGDWEIFKVNANGTGITQLTDNTAIDFEPAFSADGTRIAFTSHRDGPNTLNDEVYKMNADGTGQTRLTNNPAPDSNPTFSPDGTKIAFESQRDGNPEIYKMNADGTNLVRLTKSSNHIDTLPAWSPNGKKIAFASTRNSGIHEIYTMKPRPEGRKNRPVRLTNNEAYDYSPDWSPDGTKIAFWTNRDGDFEVYTMNANGTGQTNLTSNPAEDREPAWSPDGTQIAFVSDRVVNFENQAGNLEVYTMNADGSGSITNLSNDTAWDRVPDWQPIP